MANGLEQHTEYDELMKSPQIVEIQRLVARNIALAKILGEPHTTQPFSTADELAAAFKGELLTAGKTGLEAMERAKDKDKDLIETAGITDEDLRKVFELVWVYSRLTNPTGELLEEAISGIEGAEKTAIFASGLAAINATVRQFVPPAKVERGKYVKGGKIVVVGSIYGGTYAQLMNICKETGRQLEFLSISDFKAQGLSDHTSMVFCETSNNPTLEVVPLKRVAEEAKRVGAVSVCDNTFTSLTVRPAENGVDLTVTSMTKYFNGRSEDLGGCVSGNAELIGKFSDLKEGQRMLGGAIMAPRVAKEFLEHLANLPERLFKATQNARGVREVAIRAGFRARTVEDFPEYSEIRNPAIPASVSNGMVSLFMDDAQQASALVDMLIKEGLGHGAVSLGAEGTYYCIPGRTTHSEMPDEEMARAGITPGLVRISCGIAPDLVQKFEEVLTRFAKLRSPSIK